MQTVYDLLNKCLSTRPTHDFRTGKQRPSVSTPRSWHTGHNSSEGTLPHRCSTCHSAWVVWVWALRNAAAPWTAWQSVIPTPTEITESQDTGSLFAATPLLCSQLLHIRSTPARQMKSPALLLKPLGAALHTHGTQKTLVIAIQRTLHKQVVDSHIDNPIQKAILPSKTAKNTGAHLHLPNSEAHEAIDTTMVSPLSRTGLPHARCADVDGAATVHEGGRSGDIRSCQGRKDEPDWWSLFVK